MARSMVGNRGTTPQKPIWDPVRLWLGRALRRPDDGPIACTSEQARPSVGALTARDLIAMARAARAGGA